MTQTNLQTSISGNLVTILFTNPKDAETAYRELLSEGIDQEDIGLMMTEETKNRYFSSQEVVEPEFGNKAIEGMGVGGVIGATVGAISAALAALGTTLVIPALGIVVSGSLAASLAGAGAGAATGGLLGALIGAGIPDEKAQEYENGIQAGGVVIAVSADSEEEALQIENRLRSLQM